MADCFDGEDDVDGTLPKFVSDSERHFNQVYKSEFHRGLTQAMEDTSERECPLDENGDPKLFPREQGMRDGFTLAFRSLTEHDAQEGGMSDEWFDKYTSLLRGLDHVLKGDAATDALTDQMSGLNTSDRKPFGDDDGISSLDRDYEIVARINAHLALFSDSGTLSNDETSKSDDNVIPGKEFMDSS